MAKILLVGCGKMGRALVGGWLAQGLSGQDIVIVDPHLDGLPSSVHGVRDHTELSASFAPDIIVLAVKPQSLEHVAPLYANYTQAVFVSIAAGKPLSKLEEWLGQNAALIRAMPNTPASIRKGITALCANPRVTPAQMQRVETLMQAVGEVVILADEALMDAVTAVSGSGPAYVFLMAEMLAAAGSRLGLPDDIALSLARATIAGAGALLEASPESPQALREAVTSPNGTTFAALQVLMAEDGLERLMMNAVSAAAKRAAELAG